MHLLLSFLATLSLATAFTLSLARPGTGRDFIGGDILHTLFDVGELRIVPGLPREISQVMRGISNDEEGAMNLQNDWRWCHKCAGLFFARGQVAQGRCAAGGTHENLGSGDYSLHHDAAEAGAQGDWRWCHKCQGLFFARGQTAQRSCPAGGSHENMGSGDYMLLHDLSNIAAGSS